jgi:two-component system sensor histidine kinase YesM
MNTVDLESKLSIPGKSRSSYALSNVKSRLSLYYGDSASISFFSEPNVRTTVTLCIPKEMKEVAMHE